MRVDQAGQDQLAGSVEGLGGAVLARHLRGLADRDNLPVRDGDGAITDDPATGVDGDDPVRVLDQNFRHRLPGSATDMLG
jgi:hypothetical protein